MLFSEYYGEYYACVSEILSEAVEGTLTKERISEIASKQGFGESVLTIPANLKNDAISSDSNSNISKSKLVLDHNRS